MNPANATVCCDEIPVDLLTAHNVCIATVQYVARNAELRVIANAVLYAVIIGRLKIALYLNNSNGMRYTGVYTGTARLNASIKNFTPL